MYIPVSYLLLLNFALAWNIFLREQVQIPQQSASHCGKIQVSWLNKRLQRNLYTVVLSLITQNSKIQNWVLWIRFQITQKQFCETGYRNWIRIYPVTLWIRFPNSDPDPHDLKLLAIIIHNFLRVLLSVYCIVKRLVSWSWSKVGQISGFRLKYNVFGFTTQQNL